VPLIPPIRVPHNRLTHDEREVEAVAAVVRSGHWACGPRVAELESALAGRSGRAHAVGLASGLSALRLALQALGVGPGHEVLVPAYSCVALATAATALGAVPVPVDVEAGSWNMAPESARAALTPATKAIVAVHTFGAPAPVGDLRELGPPVVEDCAHAFGHPPRPAPDGSTLPPLGGRGDLAVLSFYATKLIGAGEGGAVLTDSADTAAFLRSHRDYTDRPPDPNRLNDKLTDLEAVLALVQLGRLDDMLARRRALASRYHDRLMLLAGRRGRLRLPPASADRVWYRYVVELQDVSPGELAGQLREQGVTVEQPVTDWRPASAAGRCPVADRAYQNLLSLPIYPTLCEEEQEHVCRSLEQALR
jgi:perosamine synthetase